MLMSVVPFMLVPNIMVNNIPMVTNEYMSYAVGTIIYAAVFMIQKVKVRA